MLLKHIDHQSHILLSATVSIPSLLFVQGFLQNVLIISIVQGLSLSLFHRNLSNFYYIYKNKQKTRLFSLIVTFNDYIFYKK